MTVAAGFPYPAQAAAILLALLMLLISGQRTHAQGLLDSSSVVDVTAHWSAPAARAGDQRVLAVVLEMQEHYHINPDASQIEPELGFLIPTRITVQQAPKGLTVGQVQYPAAQDVLVRYAGDPRTLKAYEGRIALYVPVLVESSVQPGEYPLSLSVQFQSCDEYRCLMPATQTVEVNLEVVSLDTPIGEPADPALFAAFDYAAFSRMADQGPTADLVRLDLFGLNWQLDAATKWGYILLLATAALGGLLLNFTPCVLPVIPLKIMGLSQAAGNRARCLALGVAMSAGVVAFWMVLGVVLAAVSGFTAINQLFQYPAFTVGVGVVIAVMAVGMCGLFAIPLPRAVYQLNPSHDTYHGSFGFGVMTAVLSTPCTAPVMGMAAAWAATQHPATTLLTFGAIGTGMALPYLVLSAMPQLVSRMPRTGPASEVIKQVMGLLMLGAATFFIGVGLSGWLVEPPQPPSTVYWWGVMACIAAAGGWLVWRTFRITSAAGKRVVFGSLGLLLIVGSIYTGGQLTQKAPIDWVYYTPEQFEQAQQRGDVVVLEFTAEWCLNCKAMEQAVLYDQRVVQALRQPGVTPIKVDLTGNNPVGNAKLAAVGRVAIPLLVVFSPDGEEIFKSDAYTIDQVVGAVDQALASSKTTDQKSQITRSPDHQPRYTFRMNIQSKLESLGLTLPAAPKPVASYVPAVRSGNLLYISGQLPMREGKLVAEGPVPSRVCIEDAQAAARQCALNALAIVDDAVNGDWERVVRIVRVGVFVASDTDFTSQPQVANGASDLLGQVLGEQGRHARAAVGVNVLPLGAPVEVEMIVELR